ncbi:hypothetical protein VE23_20855 [Paenibacillus sp. D9]|nr:hypothetical protein VE23_20855 [Paenibacillus sp. D9]
MHFVRKHYTENSDRIEGVSGSRLWAGGLEKPDRASEQRRKRHAKRLWERQHPLQKIKELRGLDQVEESSRERYGLATTAVRIESRASWRNRSGRGVPGSSLCFGVKTAGGFSPKAETPAQERDLRLLELEGITIS